MNLNPGDFGLADQDGEGQTLQEREVAVQAERGSLKGGEAIGHASQGVTHFFQVVQFFAQAEIGQAIAADFQAEEGGELFVGFDPGLFAGGTEDVMAVFDLAQGGVEKALQAAGEAKAEGLLEAISDFEFRFSSFDCRLLTVDCRLDEFQLPLARQ
jgi:hypothetical protein